MRKICFLIFVLVFAGHLAYADSVESAAPENTRITIYSDRALVSERRLVNASAGEFTFIARGVSPDIRPLSLLLMGGPELEVISQSYNGFPFNETDLLNYYTGKEVGLLRYPDNSRRSVRERARLLSPGPPPLFEIDGELHLGHPGYILFPDMPEDFPTSPAAIFNLYSEEEKTYEVDILYHSGGLSWRADHTLIVSEDEKSGSIRGAATLRNSTLSDFRNAEVTLVAGELSREDEVRPMQVMRRAAQDAAFSERAVEREEFSDYHMYRLPGLRTLSAGVLSQEVLFDKNDFPVKREYILQGAAHIFFQRNPRISSDVGSFIVFENTKEEGPGVPIPAGPVRVYSYDSSGSLRLSGASSISHTPVGRSIQIRTGTAFDITGERRQTSFRTLDSNTLYETSWEIRLENARHEDITVKVVERMSGEWDITSSSIPYEKKDAFSAVFFLEVPALSSAEFSYSARLRR